MMIKLLRKAIAPSLLAATLILTSCAENKNQEKKLDQSAALLEWLDANYEELLQRSPIQLTVQGRKDQYDRVDDLSEEAEDELLEWYEASVSQLKDKFDYDDLSNEDKTSYDLWIYQYEQRAEGKQFRDLNYVFHQMGGMHTFFPTFMINFHKVDSITDMQAYISRIQQTDRAIGQLVDRAEKQAAKGILPPAFTFETVLKQSKDLITGQPFTQTGASAALWTDMNAKIDALLESESIDETRAKELRDESKKALLENFKPGYDRLIAWLEKEMANAEVAPTGVSRHPNGKDYYNYALKVATTTNLTADEIHNIGLKEVERIQKEMIAIKEKAGFGGTLHEFFAFVNSDAQFFFPNTDEGRQGYLDETTQYLDALGQKLPDYFGILPKAALEVKRVESFREQDGAPQHYFPGTPDGSRAGIYYVHLSDMSMMDKTTLEGVAYHEGNPGHHMQISIAQELQSVPKFRTQAGYTAYVEGWALYAEILAKEMGGYENPYYDFGRLVNEIWRAIRLVVDTGLHSKGWTEADAIAYFTENSSISQGAIKAEVQRYMVIPGQATAYKIGMIKIQELRSRAETELGQDFDIKGFHDTLLGGGAMPLEILERRVDQWIASMKKAS